MKGSLKIRMVMHKDEEVYINRADLIREMKRIAPKTMSNSVMKFVKDLCEGLEQGLLDPGGFDDRGTGK